MPRTRPPYPPEFRREAIRLVRASEEHPQWNSPVSVDRFPPGCEDLPHNAPVTETSALVRGLPEGLHSPEWAAGGF